MKKGTAWGIWWVAVIYGILFCSLSTAWQEMYKNCVVNSSTRRR